MNVIGVLPQRDIERVVERASHGEIQNKTEREQRQRDDAGIPEREFPPKRKPREHVSKLANAGKKNCGSVSFRS